MALQATLVSSPFQKGSREGLFFKIYPPQYVLKKRIQWCVTWYSPYSGHCGDWKKLGL